MVKPHSTTRNFSRTKTAKSTLGLQRFPGEVVKRKRQQRKHDHAHPVMMQRVVIAEPGKGLLRRSLIELDTHAHQPHNATSRNQPRRIQAARTNFRLRGDLLWTAVLCQS